MKYIELSKCLTPNQQREVSRKDLIEKSGASAAIISGLVERGVLETYLKEVGRLDVSEVQTNEVFPLNEFQQTAFQE